MLTAALHEDSRADDIFSFSTALQVFQFGKPSCCEMISRQSLCERAMLRSASDERSAFAIAFELGMSIV